MSPYHVTSVAYFCILYQKQIVIVTVNAPIPPSSLPVCLVYILYMAQ